MSHSTLARVRTFTVRRIIVTEARNFEMGHPKYTKSHGRLANARKAATRGLPEASGADAQELHHSPPDCSGWKDEHCVPTGGASARGGSGVAWADVRHPKWSEKAD